MYLLVQADARQIPLPDRYVHACVCSPPYYGLRDYGIAGQLGLEPTPEAFVTQLVRVFREVNRVLRDDGTLWINIGDSYNQGAKGASGSYDPKQPARRFGVRPTEKGIPGLKPKDLIGIPWRLAFALQEDDWYLRMDNVWFKRNGMRESVQDRPTRLHEYVFLFSKSKTYYYDYMAVRERTTESTHGRLARDVAAQRGSDRAHAGGKTNGPMKAVGDPDWRNLGSVWDIPAKGYRGAHFATYPVKLVTRIIKAGTSQHGVCPACGAPWRRIIASERVRTRPGQASKCYDRATGDALAANDKPWSSNNAMGNRDPGRHVSVKRTLGWEPTCACGRTDVGPALVLDPFVGSGTSLVAAESLGRHGIGLDLSRDYLVSQARRRLERPHAPARVPPIKQEHHPLFDSVNKP